MMRLIVTLTIVTTAALLSGGCRSPIPATAPEPRSAAAPTMEVLVDPRVELLAVIFRLAGAEEYSMKSLPRYAAAIDTFFAAHRDHPVTAEVRRLRKERGISHDAVMSFAIQLGPFPDLAERVPFEDSALESRWRPAEARAFLEHVRAFASDSDFARFLKEQAPLYETAERSMSAILEAEMDLGWFPRFFGVTPSSRFILAIAPGNGTWAYGPRFEGRSGEQELYAVMNVWQSDDDGMPRFDRSVVTMIVHEFGHSFVNPVVDRREQLVRPAADTILEAVSRVMRQQGYTEPRTLVSESLVRAAVARYMLARHGADTAQAELTRQKARGFLWIDDLFALMGAYERSREQHRNLASYFPQIAGYYADLAPRISTLVAQYELRRPQVIGMQPANHAGEVDPETREIAIRFDRPMRGSYALMIVGTDGRERFPDTGQPRWDERRTVLTIPVTLRPGRTYEFSLNAGFSTGFSSREGVPLEPYPVSFSTADGTAPR